jgi:DNA-binding transcriptional ArsR family regulator
MSQRKSNPCCGNLEDFLSPKLFKALSDPTRLALLVRVAEAGQPIPVGAAGAGCGVDLSVVSRHLGILREAGALRCEKRGKEMYCRVDTAGLVAALRGLADALEACCPREGSVTKGKAKR